MERDSGLSHVDAAGRARMVDVSSKPWTHRRARARCRVARVVDRSPAPTWSEMLEHARIAGIQAAKQTARLVPLCHPLGSSDVEVTLRMVTDGVEIEAVATTVGPTGVEMEALMACCASALSIVAAVGADAQGATIEDLTLWEKSGGRSGTWRRET